jgi:hypothetical protein
MKRKLLKPIYYTNECRCTEDYRKEKGKKKREKKTSNHLFTNNLARREARTSAKKGS